MTSAVLHRGYNSCQKSCDTNAIARQNDAPLPPSRRCSVDCMDSSFFFFFQHNQNCLSREGNIRNRLLQKHSQALRRSRIRIHFAKCVSAPIFLKGTKGVFNSCSLVISIYSCKFVILINYLLVLTNWCNKRFSMPRGVF